MSGARSEGSGRKPREQDTGASSATAPSVSARPEATARLLEIILDRENMMAAYHRVVANRGAAGVDGMTVDQLKAFLVAHWSRIKEDLLAGRYQPQPVRRVDIPKPGGGTRTLGIPTVLDRLIQQAMHQVLSPLFDPGFSEASYGFRPGRSAHQAVLASRDHVAAGRRWVVDIDLEKFFDRVNHDVLMARVARKVADKRVLRLAVNGAKSAVDRPWNRTFLGFTMTAHRMPRLRVAPESVARFKGKLRALWRQGRGRSLGRTIEDFAPILAGWIAYFRLAEAKGIFEELDGWIRRRLRCLLWRQWKRPRTRAMRLRQRGLDEERAWRSAYNGHGPWWNAGASHMHDAFRANFFRSLGLVSLLDRHRRLNSAS